MSSIYAADYQAVLHLLKQTRQQKGITQKQIALAMQRPQSFVAKYENEERRLDIVEFVHIARLLGLPLHEALQDIKTGVRPIVLP